MLNLFYLVNLKYHIGTYFCLWRAYTIDKERVYDMLVFALCMVSLELGTAVNISFK